MGSGASKGKQQKDPADSNNKGSAEKEKTNIKDEPQPDTAQKSPMARQVERYGYPQPCPPTKKKRDAFDLKSNQQLDSYASKVPDNILYGSFEEISSYLNTPCQNDVQRVRALFTWTTSIDIPSLQSTLQRLPETGTPLDYLLKIHWQMGNHAHFFAQLCRSAHIPCVIVTGMNKSAAYQLGGKIDKKTMAAQWNCVYTDGEWRLLDVFWSSTCVVGKKSGEWSLMDVDGEMMTEDEEEGSGETKHQVNEAFFLSDPEAFITTHYPEDADWQLLEQPITVEDFEKRVYIRERFFDMDLSLHPQKSLLTCVVPSKDGEIQIEFNMENNIPEKQFRYLLFKSKQSNDKTPNIDLERFVFFQKKADSILYHAQFPVKGRYKMDIFGQIDKTHETFDLCASYLIDCEVAKKNPQPLPDAPDIGWGPGAECDKLGMTAVSPGSSSEQSVATSDAIITTSDGKVELRFKQTDPLVMMASMKSNQMDEWMMRNNACMSREGDELVIHMRVPQKGDYALNIFAEKENFKGELPNICNYLIKATNDNPDVKPFPKLHEGILGKSPQAAKMGVKATTQPGGTVLTDSGKFSWEFEHPENVELFCEIENVDLNSKLLSECVKITSKGKHTKMAFDLPRQGEYGMNIYARVRGEESQVQHVHTYLVTSSQADDKADRRPKNEVPLVPFTTTGDTAVVRMPARTLPVVAEVQRMSAVDGPTKDQVKGKRTDREDLFAVKLPQEGEFKMEVFEKKDGGGLENVYTYYLARQSPEEETENQDDSKIVLSEEELARRQVVAAKAAQDKVYVDQLRAAVKSQDPAALKQAIVACENAAIDDKKGHIKKAKKLMRFLQISQELKDSMSNRHLKRLEKSVEAAENEGFAKKLGLQMQMARRVLEQLRRIEKLRHEILNLDQKTIAEIKSYSKPPEGILQVMQATFLVLGNTEREVQEWPAVVVLIGKTGRESLKRRITEFDVEKLNIEQAIKAKNRIVPYQLDTIRDASAGAATFHVWVSGMVEECESRFQQEGGDLNMMRPKTSKARNRNR